MEKSQMRTMLGQELLLFYVVCDESGSMGENGGIEQVNAAFPELHATLAADPLVVDKCRLCIIAFSDEAEVILPLCRISEVEQMPGVKESGATSYGAAFRLLEATIKDDVARLSSRGYRILRPCVFFISDGDPTDEWQAAYSSLMTSDVRPSIITFGVGDAGANPSILRKVATLRCFAGRDRSRAGTALANVMTSIGNTIIVSTSRAKQRSGDGLDIPDDLEGFDSIDPVE